MKVLHCEGSGFKSSGVLGALGFRVSSLGFAVFFENNCVLVLARS